jgi:hypothetical protein
MKIEDHYENLKESLELIEESIEKGLVKRQRTIGFNTSLASADMLEIFLHKNDLIDAGFMVKHEWLKSKKSMENKLPFEFPRKEEILLLLFKIEEKRNVLCYGKPKREELIREVLDNFNKLREIFRGEGLNV